MKDIFSEEQFNEEIKEGFTIVDFYANWCGPCRMLSPILDEIAAQREDVNIIRVDVDENRELSMKYKISAIPALLMFKDNNLVNTQVGFISKDDLEEIIDNIK